MNQANKSLHYKEYSQKSANLFRVILKKMKDILSLIGPIKNKKLNDLII